MSRGYGTVERAVIETALGLGLVWLSVDDVLDNAYPTPWTAGPAHLAATPSQREAVRRAMRTLARKGEVESRIHERHLQVRGPREYLNAYQQVIADLAAGQDSFRQLRRGPS